MATHAVLWAAAPRRSLKRVELLIDEELERLPVVVVAQPQRKPRHAPAEHVLPQPSSRRRGARRGVAALVLWDGGEGRRLLLAQHVLALLARQLAAANANANAANTYAAAAAAKRPISTEAIHAHDSASAKHPTAARRALAQQSVVATLVAVWAGGGGEGAEFGLDLGL